MTQRQLRSAESQGTTEQEIPAAAVVKYAGTAGLTFVLSAPGTDVWRIAQLVPGDLCLADSLKHSIREYRERHPEVAAVTAPTWVGLYEKATDAFMDRSDDAPMKGLQGAGESVSWYATLVIDEDGILLRTRIGDQNIESPYMHWGDIDHWLGLGGPDEAPEMLLSLPRESA